MIVVGEYSFSFHEGSHVCDTTYSWYCDECGTGFDLVFTDGGKTIKQTVNGKRSERTLALLTIRGTDKATIVNGVKTQGHTTENQRYWYEEHSCPSNFFRMCEETVNNGWADCHEMFEYVDEICLTGSDAVDKGRP